MNRGRFKRLSILVAGLLGACSPLAVLNATVPSGGVHAVRDIAYGAGPRMKLDVYEPPVAGADRPLIVFFFGGSWKFGNRGQYAFVATALAKRGFVVAVPDYRLYPEVRFPDFLHDCAAAVAFAARHAAEYGASAHPFIMGHSAGAYNALMVALDPEYLAAAGFDRNQLSGAIGLAGPYDFTPSKYPDISAVFAGFDRAATQPIVYADGHAPPLLLLAGLADKLVMPRNTVALAAAETAHGGVVETKYYPGVGHIGLILSFAPLFQVRAPALNDVTAFVRARARPSP